MKKIFKNWKIILLMVCVVMALVAIWPNPWTEGVAIRSVVKDSAASVAGFTSPSSGTTPMNREVITHISNVPIKNVKDYESVVSNLKANTTVVIKTDKTTYRVLIRPEYELITLEDNSTISKVVGVEDIGLRVYDAPKSNLKMGLDLQGGSRIILKPEEDISDEEITTLVDNMKQRLNVYGLSDITVRPTSDLEGNNFIIVEIAGATDEDIKNLIAKQGKFEAKIGNTTVFKGGSDIKHVCKTPDCSMITSCNLMSDGQNVCEFSFQITLSPEAAELMAETTATLDTSVSNGEVFLSQPLDLYLDDELVDSLRIGESLKGRAETDISISGSGIGVTSQDAMNDAGLNMKKLQTVLVTGSLPVKLSIEDSSSVSAVLGSEFISNTLTVGALALLFVILAIVIRYRKWVVSIPVAITLLSEVILLLGFGALIGWNIDLISIAAIIIAIGTGIDSQVVIIDEIAGKHKNVVSTNWKDKMKNAFFIVMASYFTLVVAMIPLLSAGAGLLKGFAITTILGASIGVFITRPAFAIIAEELLKDKETSE
jgi:preprotein translocase subunit SecD